MSSQEYAVFESLLERLHAARNECLLLAYWLSLLSENQADFERISKIKTLCETPQGVIDCLEKKLCDVDPSSYVSSWIPEALVHQSGLVGSLRLALNPVQVEFLHSWWFSWTRIAFTLCIKDDSLEAS